MMQYLFLGWSFGMISLGLGIFIYKSLSDNADWAANEIIRHEGHEAERYVELMSAIEGVKEARGLDYTHSAMQHDNIRSVLDMLRQEQGGMRTEMSKRFRELEQQIEGMEERARTDADD